MENKNTGNKQDELRRGVIVFIALAVLTGIEYVIGTQEAPRIFLWMIAMMKGGLVIWFFMHIKRIFGEGGH
jgi:uncharacterized membrane protein YagU involved in acid resistance